MANMMIHPGKLGGKVKIPSSKSMAHRAIICAALSNGVSRLSNIDESDDLIATMNGMKSLGARIEKKDDILEVTGIYAKATVALKPKDFVIDCNESGSTLRFLVPISLVIAENIRFIGKGNLGKRPMNTYYDIFDEQGIIYETTDELLALKISGSLKAGDFYVSGNVSSQFITGLMLTLPLLDGDSRIIITTKLESKGYLDLTLKALKDFGIEVINHEYKKFVVKGNQTYKARDYSVEGDYSQAAFFLSAGVLGHDVTLLGLDDDSLQGDREVLDILKRIGAEILKTKEGIKAKADILNHTIIDAAQCPDIIPVLSLVASLSKGTTQIINAGRLRIKECDRLHAVRVELNKLGAKIEEKAAGLVVHGVTSLQGGVSVWSHNDHRIAMTLAIAGTLCKEPITIEGYGCVSKSYPSFFEDFKQLGGETHVG